MDILPGVNYNTSSFSINPDEVKKRADEILVLAKDIVDSLNNINDTLSALKMGWAGATADEAQDFGNRWNSVMTELFGDKDHPEKGVLNVIVGGLDAVRWNYAWCEDGVFQMFHKWGLDMMEGSSGGTPTTPPPSMNNTDLSAITETW